MRSAYFKFGLVMASLLMGASFLAGACFFDHADASRGFDTDSQPSATPETQQLALADIEFDGVRIERTEDGWRQLLSPAEFSILRQEGTERAFSGELDKNKRKGNYHCAACGLVVFRSSAKFDSGTGWPSFYKPAYKKNIAEKTDRSLPSEERIEVECARCGSHLGHVFDDGPRPTGLRYCINSLALRFDPK